jgi:deoxyribose-phosphate aldolase
MFFMARPHRILTQNIDSPRTWICSETQQAIQDGALEIDTVIPLGLLLSKPPQYTHLFQHLQSIIQIASPIPVKVIIETALIPPELKITALCVLAAEAGAAFVKTCTGFAAGGGATAEDVRLMRTKAVKYYRGDVKVKASGGIRTFEACKEMFAAGAERIGTCVPCRFFLCTRFLCKLKNHTHTGRRVLVR